MTWNDVLIKVVTLIFEIILTVGIPCLFAIIRKKINNDAAKNIILDAEQFVVDSVRMVNQTFVDDLKEQGKFDIESQKIAFKMCYDNWMNMANEKMKEVIIRKVGNLEEWLTTKIESAVCVKD